MTTQQLQNAEKVRRRRRYELRLGSVHQRKNRSDGRGGQRSNKGKAGSQWKREEW